MGRDEKITSEEWWAAVRSFVQGGFVGLAYGALLWFVFH